MNRFIFDLQRFSTQEITSGESFTLDGVKYTAVNGDAVLNIDDYGKVSGIASGKVDSTVDGNENSPVLTFDASDGAINFSLTGNNGVLTMTNVFAIEFNEGKFNYKGNILTASAGSIITNVAKLGKYSTTSKDEIEFDATYTFGNNSFTSTSEHISSTYTLTDGSDVKQLQLDTYGTVTNNFNTRGFTLTKDSSAAVKIGDYTLTATAVNKDAGMNMEVGENGFTLIPNQNDGTLNIVLKRGDTAIISGELECTEGSITLGYDNSITLEKNTSFDFKRGDYIFTVTSNDTATTGIILTENGISFTPDDNDSGLNISISRSGTTVFDGKLNVSGGTISFNPTTQEFSVTEGTEILFAPDDSRQFNLKVVDSDASFKVESDGQGNFSITPNQNDGALELNFVTGGRKATLDVNGAIILGDNGKISLEDGTEANITWEDGTKLKLISHGSTGSIGFDAEKGIKITSDDENLNIDLTTADGVQTQLSGIKGTIYYNAGTVSFDENSTITATTTLGGEPILMTLDTIGGTGHISFAENGVIYSADTGALKITWTKDNRHSTFTVNSGGSVHIGHNLFKIAEGTELSTDLQDFVPALYFTTSEAGTYTINGQTITTTAEGLALTATDNYMSFVTSDDVVNYDGMTFAGAGKVSLSSDSVVLGAGVVANGFGEGNSFVLAEAGNVTADAKIFELTQIEDVSREIPMVITVTGAQNGFIFSRKCTKESEAYIDKVFDDDAFANYTSPYIGKVFVEKFISAGDSSYRIRTDAIGLEEVIGISDGATITGGAILDNEPSRSYFNLVTDTEGKFTIGEKSYTVSGDSNIAITALFDVGVAPYASYFDSLNGTVSGDFSGGKTSINGSSTGILIYGDTSLDIVTNENGFEIFNFSDGATLDSTGGASKIHTDTQGVFQFGTTETDSLAVTVTSDNNITFEFDSDQDLINISDFNGNLQFSETTNDLTINGINIDFTGDFSSISAYTEDGLYIHDVSDGSKLTTDSPDKVCLQMLGESMAINNNNLTLLNDSDGLWIRDKEIVGLDEGASLQVSEAGTYTFKTTYPNFATRSVLNAKSGDILVGLGNDYAYIYDPNKPIITKNTTTEEMLEMFSTSGIVIAATEADSQAITLAGGSLAIIEDTSAQVNISSGDNNTIVSKGKNVSIDLTGGKTDIFVTGGNMTLNGYDDSTGTGFATNYGNILSAVESDLVGYLNNELYINGTKVNFGTDNAIVNLYDIDGKLQKVGFAEDNAELDATQKDKKLILSGGNNSTLRGGSKNDTILAGEGSLIDGGDGNNKIYLTAETLRTNNDGSKIIANGNGRDTVYNFREGFGSSADSVIVDNLSNVKIKFSDEDLVLVADDARLTFNGADTLEKLHLTDGNADIFAFVANDDEFVKVTDDDGTPNAFVGHNSGLDFSDYNGDININLENSTFNSQNSYFSGINKLQANKNNSTLIGSDGNETLIAGNGNTSLYGSGGNDSLVGQGDSADKTGSTNFYFSNGDGRDAIANFGFITPENQYSGVEDKINIDENSISDVHTSGDKVVIGLDEDNYLILEDAIGKDFRINNFIAKVDKNILYDGLADCYVADGGNSLTVDENVDNVEIWLDNTHEKLFLGQSIRTLDASNAKGNTSLVGNNFDNTIIGGQGDSSLWGNDIGNDLLIGGQGKNTFFYGIGNGNDTIQGINDGDVVNLGDITLAQISDANISADSVSIRFNDGGSLQINGTADITYQLADGTKFSANHQQLSWQAK